MLHKSQEYIDGAQFLHDNRRYCLVSHAAYYSCLLKMNHWLKVKNLADYNNYLSLSQQASSHETLIKTCLNNIADVNKKQDFKRSIRILKEYRVKADYRTDNIGRTDSKRLINLANSVLGEF